MSEKDRPERVPRAAATIAIITVGVALIACIVGIIGLAGIPVVFSGTTVTVPESLGTLAVLLAGGLLSAVGVRTKD